MASVSSRTPEDVSWRTEVVDGVRFRLVDDGKPRQQPQPQPQPRARAAAEFERVVDVPVKRVSAIVGKRGETAKRLSAKHGGCTIALPPRNSGSGSVTVRGPSAEAVAALAAEILEIVADGRGAKAKGGAYTHFVGVPLNTPEMVGALRSLRRDALAACAGTVDESLFAAPERCHFTLVMLRLDTPERVAAAAEAVAAAAAAAATGGGVDVAFDGLHAMEGRADRANVVYARPAEGAAADALQRVARGLCAELRRAGLVDTEELRRQKLIDSEADGSCASVRVTLHATVLNTRYRAERGGGRRKPFDASDLLRSFGGRRLPAVRADVLSLSRLGGSGGGGGYYSEDARAQLA